MSSKTISIPFGMITRKFYCHQCGQKLLRHRKTRTLHPGDPDYKKYAIHRTGNKVTFWTGDAKVIEYDFHCPNCNITTQYDKQLIIEHIQKKLGKPRLTQSEITTQEAQAKIVIDRRNTLRRILWGIAMLALIAVSFYFSA